MNPSTQPIAHESWTDFLDHVRTVRQLQQLYRRTLDPAVRRNMGHQELLLDAKVDCLSAVALAAAEHVEAEAEVEAVVEAVVEGGVA